MRSVTYSMGVSLDGYIVGPDGGFDWGGPDEEVFRFWIDEIRGVGVHLLGRRLYETMLYWETAEQKDERGGCCQYPPPIVHGHRSDDHANEVVMRRAIVSSRP